MVKEKKLFSNINCFHFGSTEPGLLAIEGKIVKGISMKEAEDAVNLEITTLLNEGVTDKELEKVKNKTESMMAFEDMSLVSRAASLAIYELLGDADLINQELLMYQQVTAEDITQESRKIFNNNNCNTLYYYSK